MVKFILPDILTKEVASEGEPTTRSSSTAAPVPPPWSSEPRSLKSPSISSFLMNVYDILLCFMPIALIFKCCLVISAEASDRFNVGPNFDQVGALTQVIVRLNSQLTTASTVIFVLIFTTALHRFALYRAQCGDYVARLEQYQASTSIPSTLRAIVSLRAFDLTSLGLVVLWSFYFLGSQANVREYVYAEALGKYQNFNVAYLSPDAPSMFANASYEGYTRDEIDAMNLRYGVYMTTSYDRGSDFNGAVVVPSLENATSTTNATADIVQMASISAWNDVPTGSGIGFPSNAGTYIFYQLGAAPGELQNQNAVMGDFLFNSSYMLAACVFPTVIQEAQLPKNFNVSTFAMTTILNNTIRSANNFTDAQRITMWSRYNASSLIQSSCGITKSYVEVKAHCNGVSCIAREIRQTPGPLPSETRTQLDDDAFSTRFCGELSRSYMSLTKQAAGFLSMETDLDIYGNISPPDAFGALYPQQLSYGLTKVLNTYYYASQMPTSSAINLPGDIDIQAILNNTSTDARFSLGRMHGAFYQPRYVLSKPWLALDFLSNIILFFAALAAFWIRKNTLAPNILGYVSTMTRDNPHLDVPEGGSTLSGMARARLLKGLKVRVLDIGAHREVGQVAMANAGERTRRGLVGLRTGKRYA